MRHIILGTAGHIDHGKSSLVKALTGTDPDRLKEEKERGITIDIGFADLIYQEDGLSVGIVDVPGHERLVRNMLAGAGGIDLVLLVVAADEGIMPQSREHLAICNLLQIKSGLIALTKSDLVDKEWLGLVEDEVRETVKGTFLEHAEIVPVSSKTGANLDALKKAIKDAALKIRPKSSDGLFRLPIDRVFTLKGFGTVITGTAVSGRISVEDQIQILPAGINTKVRGLQSHGHSIDTAYAGQRVAINLQGVEKEDIKRGDAAVTPDAFAPTKTIDAFLSLLDDAPPLKSKSLVHLYSGTSEATARVILYDNDEIRPGESSFCQFRLNEHVMVMSGDRFIVRRFSPLETLGGGEILDPSPGRRRLRDGIEDLRVLQKSPLSRKIALKIQNSGPNGIRLNILRGWINAELKTLSESVDTLISSGEILRNEDVLLHNGQFELHRKKITALLGDFHKINPLKQGMPKEEVRNQLKIEQRLFNFILSKIDTVSAEKNLLRLKDFRVALSSQDEEQKKRICDLIDQGGFQPPSKEELASTLKIDIKHMGDILGLLSKDGLIVKMSDSLYLSKGSYDRMIMLIRNFYSRKSEMTVAEFRDLLNTSRKFALPYIEYLDANRVTLRTGDVRKLLSKP